MNERFMFRVWSKKYKMYLEDRCYPVGHSNFYISQEGTIFEDSGPVDEWDENPPCRFGNPDYIAEQCTGLKDRNGKLIFEGDICRDGIVHEFVVTWDDENARFLGFTIPDRRIIFVGREPKVEIVGNIHETEAANAD